MLARLRRYYRLAVVSLLTLALTLPMRPAAAYAPPTPPYGFNSLGQLVDLSRQWGPVSMVTGSAGAAAAVGALGISPLGWAAIGLALAGALMLSSDTESPQGYTAVIVGAQLPSIEPNPDIGLAADPVVKTGPWVFTLSNYIYTDTMPGSVFATNSLKYWILGRLGSGEVNYIKDVDLATLKWGADCPLAGNMNSSTQKVACYMGRTTLGAGTWFWNYQVFKNNIPGKTCSTDFQYDPLKNKCIYTPATLDDGICRVSPTPAGTDYEYNQVDPDCMRAVSKMKLTVNPGSANSPPSVVMQDPGTGNVVVASGSSGSGTAPFTLTERAPNRTTQVVKQTTVTTSPGTVTPDNPKAQPVLQNTDSSYHHGSNPNVAPTGPAISEVAVSNWPSTVNVSGTVSCSNCTTSAPNVTVNVPDHMKIDGEVPGEFSTLPVAPADMPAPATFLAKLQTRLAGFLNFTLPAHTSSCPALDISFHAWAVNIDASSNFMCTFLEENRPLFQGLMTFAFTVGAILILLGA